MKIRMGVALLAGLCAIARADDSAGLGAPSVPIAAGSGVVVGGLGTYAGGGSFTVNVPGDVVQALLYWAGEHRLASGDGEIAAEFNGNPLALTGTLIGGPTYFFNFNGPVYVSTYRADVTAQVTTGLNQIGIDGMEFDASNLGAGLLVIYDDGTTADIALRDGQDLAFARFAPPLDATVPQTFVFPAIAQPRTAKLNLFAADVGVGRPNRVRVQVDAAPATDYDNLLNSTDGADWDSVDLPVAIPAGATSVTVEVISFEDGSDVLPASLTWVMAGLSVPVPTCGDGHLDDGEECDDGNVDSGDGCSSTCTEEPAGGEGCTPGYWKQCHHFDSWVKYKPHQKFNTVFGVCAPGNKTLLQALTSGGGGADALNRHAVAALLNATSGISYAYTEAEVIALVKKAYKTRKFNCIKDQLEEENEQGCPLN